MDFDPTDFDGPGGDDPLMPEGEEGERAPQALREALVGPCRLEETVAVVEKFSPADELGLSKPLGCRGQGVVFKVHVSLQGDRPNE